MQPKRIITMLLVVALTLCCFATTVAAEDAKKFDMAVEVKSSTAVIDNPLNVRPGDSVDVSVTIKNNPGIITLKFALNYDAEALELVSNTAADIFTSAEQVLVDDEVEGKVWYEAHSADFTSAVNATGAVLTLNFKVKDTFHGDTEITFSDYDKEIVGEGFATDLVVSATDNAIVVHKYGEAVSTSATCLESGLITYTCSYEGCGHKLEIVKEAKADHDLTGPTCTEDQKCKNEGCNFVGEKATGHDYGPWVVEEAEEGEDAKEVRTCKNCGEKETRDAVVSDSGIDTTVIILIIVAVVVVAGGAFCAYWFGFKNKKKSA